MGSLPWRKFVFLLIQVFIVLKFYAWWDENTHQGLGSFLILVFVLFWAGVVLLDRLEMGPSVSRLMHFKDRKSVV